MRRRLSPARTSGSSRRRRAGLRPRSISWPTSGKQPALPPVCVMTPRSGWYFNASERGGGLVCWLEALRACAVARPLRTVRFVASSGHELGHLGLHAYLTRNPTLARDAAAWIHFGANIGAATGEVRLTCSDKSLESSDPALTPYDLNRVALQPALQVGGEPARSAPKAAASSCSSAATIGFTTRVTDGPMPSISRKLRASRGRPPTLQSRWPIRRRSDSFQHGACQRVNMHRTLSIVAVCVLLPPHRERAEESRDGGLRRQTFHRRRSTIPEMQTALARGVSPRARSCGSTWIASAPTRTG